MLDKKLVQEVACYGHSLHAHADLHVKFTAQAVLVACTGCWCVGQAQPRLSLLQHTICTGLDGSRPCQHDAVGSLVVVVVGGGGVTAFWARVCGVGRSAVAT